ncbi:hypothetical protein [Psychrobacillus psychrotolerans]|uniref:hypothetical protein n=1 Tax=Psychrobacillus psychrotolerans TaxID=126156 RepID=UPI000B87D3D5|nr:hypothetical protein [Psychrobacillus psychrotolerans]
MLGVSANGEGIVLFYFKSGGTQYCSRGCLEKVITWEEYGEIYGEGNGEFIGQVGNTYNKK